jgi:VanZ family protein
MEKLQVNENERIRGKSMRESLYIRWLPVVLWAMFIFITSANPNPHRPLPASWSRQTLPAQSNHGPKRITYNKLLGRYLHAAEYLILAALIALGLVGRGDLRLVLLVIAIGISMHYALSDEIHQHFVPRRAFEFRDLALDLGGSLLGIIAFATFLTLWRRRVR